MNTKRLLILSLFFLLLGTVISSAQIAGNDIVRKYGGVTIHSSENVNGTYPADRLIDGVTGTTTAQQCRSNSLNSSTYLTVILDLGKEYDLAGTSIVHGGSTSYVVQKYMISVGNDPDQLTQLVSKTGQSGNGDKTDAFPAGTKGRYIKLEAGRTSSGTLYLSEFRVFASVEAPLDLISYHFGSVKADSGAEGAEPTSNLLDGVTHVASLSQKWCKNPNNNNFTHWVIIDLGVESDLTSFKIYDCKVNEPGENNFSNYNIYVGNELTDNNITIEGVAVEPVIMRVDEAAMDIKEGDFPAATRGRYVKLEIPNFNVLRIWEFEIYGVGAGVLVGKVEDKKIIDDAVVPVSLSYTLFKEKQNFSYEVASNNSFIAVTNIADNDNSISFELSGPVNHFEAADITVKIANDGEEVSRTFKAKTYPTNPAMEDYVNVALNKTSGTWSYPIASSTPGWSWDANSANMTDGDIETYYRINKTMVSPIVDLGDKYIVSAIRFIYQFGNSFGGYSVMASPQINIPRIDEDPMTDSDYEYMAQNNEFLPGEAGKHDEYLVFNSNYITGSIKATMQNVSVWSASNFDAYELFAYCRKPVLSPEDNQDIFISEINTLEIPFDLKGFIHSNRDNIQVSVVSDNQDITIENTSCDFNTNKIKFDVLAVNEPATGKITVTLSNPDFSVSGELNVTSKIAERKTENLAVKYSSIHSYSKCEGNEHPKYTIDGLKGMTTPTSMKWCAVSTYAVDNWMIIDLGIECQLDSFAIYDGNTRETYGNAANYTIYAGNDVDNLTQLIAKTGQSAISLKQDKLEELVSARYIKLNINEKVVRIYEFEIWGYGPPVTIDPVEVQKIVDGRIVPVTVSYLLEGSKKEDFMYSVAPSKNNVIISNINESVISNANGKTVANITFDISSTAVFASDDIIVSVKNNGVEVSKSIKAKVITTNPSPQAYINVAKNKQTNVDYKVTSWTTTTTDLLTDGDKETFFTNTPSIDIDPRINMADQYMVSSVQYIYELKDIHVESEFLEAVVNISPEVNQGREAVSYTNTNETFPGGGVDELRNEFVVFDQALLTGTLQIKNIFDNQSGLTNRSMNLYEVLAFCEAPVMEPVADLKLERFQSQIVQVEFDLKGFANINKNHIQIIVSPTANSEERIQLSDIAVDYETNKINFTVIAGAEEAVIPCEVYMITGDFEIKQAVNVKIEGGIISVPASLGEPENVNVKEQESVSKEIVFSLGTEIKDTNFDIRFTVKTTTIAEITGKNINETEGKVSYQVKGLSEGSTEIEIELINGITSIKKSFTVSVEKVVPASLGEPESITLKENENVSKELSFSLGTTAKENNFDITFTVKAAAIAEITDKNINETDGKVSYEVKGLAAGNTEIEITLLNGIDTVKKTFTVTIEKGDVGIKEYQNLLSKVWPNPVTAGENILIETSGVKSVRIISLDGTVLLEQTVMEDITVISSSLLSAGSYIIQLNSVDGKYKPVKIVVR